MSNQENGNAPAANARPAAAPAANGRGRNFTFDEDRLINDSYYPLVGKAAIAALTATFWSCKTT